LHTDASPDQAAESTFAHGEHKPSMLASRRVLGFAGLGARIVVAAVFF
jgi:hypothetical protein